MITDSKIAMGDQLGAQMCAYANLYCIAKENSQQLVFWEELIPFRRGLQFIQAFDISQERVLKANIVCRIVSLTYCGLFCGRGDWKKKFRRIYKSRLLSKFDAVFLRWVQFTHKNWMRLQCYQNGVRIDSGLKNLGAEKNYDIQSGFGTYRDWGKYEEELVYEFRFKKETEKAARYIWNSLNLEEDKETVSVHFRRTDYLLCSSLNLSDNYYRKALSLFEKDKHIFLIFSDDIEECKSFRIFEGLDVRFMPKNDAVLDMCLMTMCDHNIVANSTFSFWGGVLNRHNGKKVVCPYKFIGESDLPNQFINGNWYPQSWIALDEV